MLLMIICNTSVMSLSHSKSLGDAFKERFIGKLEEKMHRRQIKLINIWLGSRERLYNLLYSLKRVRVKYQVNIYHLHCLTTLRSLLAAFFQRLQAARNNSRSNSKKDHNIKIIIDAQADYLRRKLVVMPLKVLAMLLTYAG